MPMRSWLPSDRPVREASADARLYDLHELALRLNRSLDQHLIVEQAVAWAAALGFGAAVVQQKADDTLRIAANGGLAPPLLEVLQATPFMLNDQTMPGYAALHRRALLVADAVHAQRFAELRAIAHDRAPGAALALPLVAGDRCAAVLLIYAEAAADLDQATTSLLELLSRETSQALENAAALADLHAHEAQLEQRYSQLRRAYDLIAAERRRLAAIVECASEAILVIDARGVVQLGNRAAEAVLGIHPDLLIGHPLEHAPAPEALAAAVDRARVSAERREGEFALPDGRAFRISVAPVQSLHLPPQAYVILFKDVTSFKQLDKIKNQFVATVSHDMKSPLNIISSYTELLELAGELNEEQAEYTQHILTSVRRLNALVSDLLDLARIEAGVGLLAAPCDIMMILDAAAEEYRLSADAKRIDLSVRHTGDLPLVWGDEGRLLQIVSNLLSNALAYTPLDGTVWLSAEAAEGVVKVRVEDSGIGIRTQDVSHIFEPFFRADAAKDFSSAGTGLGLAIVKRIVEEHGGAVGVESAINGGSRFWFTIPIARLDE
jgi:PAS domain S-box-containing protein